MLPSESSTWAIIAKSGAYSAGNKRKLSAAIALLEEPQIVLMVRLGENCDVIMMTSSNGNIFRVTGSL